MSRELTVEGMSCGGCEQNVVDALEAVEGVKEANADHESDSATVEGEAADAELLGAVEDAGYSASA